MRLQQVAGMQISWPYSLYDSCGDTRGHSVACGKWEELQTIIFPQAADRPVMKSMPHLLKRDAAVSELGLRHKFWNSM